MQSENVIPQLAVDAQIFMAAAELDQTQLTQPEWIWHSMNSGLTTYGRWHTNPKQAPYIRADIVLEMLAREAAALKAENLRLRSELDAAKADIAMLIQKEVDSLNV